jgi:hypothetical protein
MDGADSGAWVKFSAICPRGSGETTHDLPALAADPMRGVLPLGKDAEELRIATTISWKHAQN